MLDLSVHEVVAHDIDKLFELTENEDLMAKSDDLGYNSVEDFKFARRSHHGFFRIVIGFLVLQMEWMVTDLSQLHHWVIHVLVSTLSFRWVLNIPTLKDHIVYLLLPVREFYLDDNGNFWRQLLFYLSFFLFSTGMVLGLNEVY